MGAFFQFMRKEKPGCDSGFFAHSSSNSRVERSGFEIVNRAPFGERFGCVVNRYRVVIATIAGLFLFSSPTNVSGFVSPVIVDSVQGMLETRANANVGKEIVEGVSPAFTDHNPTPAIVWVMNVVGVMAPTFHTLPNVVSRARKFNGGCIGFGHNGSCDGIFDSHSTFNTPGNSSSFDVVGFEPFRQALSFSRDTNHSVMSSVSILCDGIGPTTVFGRVRTVDIDSVERVIFERFSSHIGEEVFVTVPAFTNGNSSCSIMSKCGVIGVSAPISHTRPYSIFGGFAPVTSFSVFFIDSGSVTSSVLDAIASTRGGFAITESGSKDDTFVATIAAAKPSTIFSSDNQPSTKTLPFQIYHFHNSDCNTPMQSVERIGVYHS